MTISIGDREGRRRAFWRGFASGAGTVLMLLAAFVAWRIAPVVARLGEPASAGTSPAGESGTEGWRPRLPPVVPEIARDGSWGPAPGDWQLEAENGRPVRLGDLRGRVVLLTQWAIWCRPCLAELPTIAALQSDLGEPRFVPLVVTAERFDESRRYLERNAPSLPAFFSREGIPAVLSGRILPVSHLLACDGSIVFRKLGAGRWNTEAMRDAIRGLVEDPACRGPGS